jgi:DMSO/TMAO reductase YedYZ heme-binding membrane subunit
LAFVTMIPLLLTSNNYAIRLLKRNWKRFQKLTYLFFIASGIHIYMVGGKWPFTIVPMSIWAVVWMVAYLRNRSNH